MSDNKKSTGLIAAAPTAVDWPHSSILNPPANYEWSRILLTDLHGVGFDWEGNFLRFVQSRTGMTFNTERKFYEIKRDPSQAITPEHWNELFIEFVRLPEGYGALTPNLDIIRQYEEIAKAGIKIVIATVTPGATDLRPDFGAMGFHHGIAQRVTKALILKHLGHIVKEQDIIFCRHAGEKKHLMFDMHCPIIVEDHPVTAVDVATCALSAILVPRSYNDTIRNVQNVLRLDNDNQLADAVLTAFEALLDRDVLAKG
jgi:hypothetical protein